MEVAQEWINISGVIHSFRHDGNSLIDIAITCKRCDLLLEKFVIAAPELVSVVNAEGRYPHECAIYADNLDAYSFLLPKTPKECYYKVSGENILFGLLSEPTLSNSKRILINDTIERFPDLLYEENVDGMTPLIVALRRDSEIIGTFDKVRTVLKLQPTVATQVYRCPQEKRSISVLLAMDRQIPLHMITRIASRARLGTAENLSASECIRFLLKIYPDGASIEDGSSRMPYHYLSTECIMMKRVLLRANPHADINEFRSLNWAARKFFMFLAYGAITSEGYFIFRELRERKLDCLKHVVSFL
jgi:hypothetical protein